MWPDCSEACVVEYYHETFDFELLVAYVLPKGSKKLYVTALLNSNAALSFPLQDL